MDIVQALCNFSTIFKNISNTAVVSDIAVVVKGLVIIYRLSGAEDFREDHLIFRRTKRGISRNWERKRGDRWKFRGGTTQICLENGEGGGWGVDPESHQTLLGGITSVK